jgi:hypothetical protein
MNPLSEEQAIVIKHIKNCFTRKGAGKKDKS